MDQQETQSILGKKHKEDKHAHKTTWQKTRKDEQQG